MDQVSPKKTGLPKWVGPPNTNWIPIGLSVPNEFGTLKVKQMGVPKWTSSIKTNRVPENGSGTQKWTIVPKNGPGTQKQTDYPKIDWVSKNGLCPHKEIQVATMFC